MSLRHLTKGDRHRATEYNTVSTLEYQKYIWQ